MTSTDFFSFSMKGQASIESLLLWSAMAASLALVLPVALHSIQAYSILLQVNELSDSIRVIQHGLDELSFSFSGSQMVFFVPSFDGLRWVIKDDSVLAEFSSTFFPSPKVLAAKSPVPLSGFVSNDGNIVLVRTISGITIR